MLMNFPIIPFAFLALPISTSSILLSFEIYIYLDWAYAVTGGWVVAMPVGEDATKRTADTDCSI
jgi:hypothetical protein